MGVFAVEFEVGDPRGRRWQRLEALVEAGSSYTWVPRDVLERLGVRPAFRRRFVTTDGRILERDVAVTRVRLDGQVLPTPVVFGDLGGPVMLGAVTLEEFGLAVDPLGRRLLPVPGYAA